MDDVSRRILESLLDNLDRLYDGHCTPADTRDLLRAAAVALGDTSWPVELLRAADAINAYEQPQGLSYSEAMTDRRWRDHALAVTDQLRLALAAD